jgi:endoglucanase
MTRRKFLQSTVSTAAITVTARLAPAADAPAKPLWYGFNLLEKFNQPGSPFKEDDFKIMNGWGFNFVRLPLSYLCWGAADDMMKIDERKLADIDQAVELGRKHRIHVNLNFHRAPGYCVNPPAEPADLWTDPKALDACAHHWGTFAGRFKGVSSDELSFNLLNEPRAEVTQALYEPVIRRLVQAIRAEDAGRPIFIDGLKWGSNPVANVADLGLIQSTRGYQPMRISHHKASWIGGSDKWPEPTWPLKTDKGDLQDRAWLQKQLTPWKAAQDRGTAVHAGEWGAFSRTPHSVALAWMKDQLAVWKEAGMGWALWNLRGGFGVLDSWRPDVKYEDFAGRKLDRKMLEVLLAGKA